MKNNLLLKLLIAFGFLVVIYKIGDIYGTNKIDSYLKSNFGEKNNLKYKDLSVNFLLGNIALAEVTMQQDSLVFKAAKIKLSHFSYYQYFINDIIVMSSVETENSKITGRIFKKEDQNDKEKSTDKKKLPKINIKKINFENVHIDIRKNDNFPLQIKRGDVILKDFVLDSLSNSSIPFNYSEIKTTIKGFESQIAEIQSVKFSMLTFEKENFQVDSLEIIPLKSRENYVYHIPYEKDLLTLFIKKINIPSFKIHNKERLFFDLDTIFINQSNFNVYADKVALEHPNKRKNLYSKSIRDLPFDLDINKVKIKNTRIVYEELTNKERKPGLISFDDINAEISDLTNVKRGNQFPSTLIHINSRFMNTSSLEINWSFKTNSVSDEFKISGSLLNVPKESINSFMKPTINVEVEGRINQLYFNIFGNDDVSNGDFEIDFDNFKLNLLDDGKEKKVLSWIVNLFVKDSSKNGLIKTEIQNLERDKTRSFWNYFWKNIQKGFKQSIT